jgi:hypothetical protein
MKQSLTQISLETLILLDGSLDTATIQILSLANSTITEPIGMAIMAT